MKIASRLLGLSALATSLTLAGACASSSSPLLHKLTVPETRAVLQAALGVVERERGPVTLVLSSDHLPEIQEAASQLRPVLKIAGRPQGDGLTLQEGQFRLEEVRISGTAAEVVGVLGPAAPPTPRQADCGSTYRITLDARPDATWSLRGFTLTHC